MKTEFIKPNIIKKNANVDARVIQVKTVQQKLFTLYFQSSKAKKKKKFNSNNSFIMSQNSCFSPK